MRKSPNMPQFLYPSTLLILLLATTTSVMLASPHSIQNLNIHFQRFVMRVVRDIGRHKSRKRRFETSEKYGLVAVLLHKDDSSIDAFLNESLSEEMDIVSLEELASATGPKTTREEDDDDPRLWIAVMGYVFDVSAGAKFYGVGGPYHGLTGRDATFALALGDLTLVDDKVVGRELTREADLAEARRWLEYFAGHDKYVRVGRLPNGIDPVVNLDLLVEQEINHAQNDHHVDDLDADDNADIIEKDANESKAEEKSVPKWHPKVPVEVGAKNCPGAVK